jgi:hypothetical protein
VSAETLHLHRDAGAGRQSTVAPPRGCAAARSADQGVDGLPERTRLGGARRSGFPGLEELDADLSQVPAMGPAQTPDPRTQAPAGAGRRVRATARRAGSVWPHSGAR